MSSEPTVLFCIGATKSGTSWFHRFLTDHPQCHMRSVKELHYFDALDLDAKKWQLVELKNKRDALVSRRNAVAVKGADMFAQNIEDHDALIALHEAGSENTAGYLSYLNGGRGDKPLVADITPAYALLSAERFASMAKTVTETRFLYILRDPVSRLWSHIRMMAKRRNDDLEQIQALSDRIFWRFGRGRFDVIRERGDYEGTIGRMRTALRPGQFLTVFYEELFTGNTMERICDFLGISPAPARFTVPVNAGIGAQMNADQIAHAQQWLAPQYEYVHAQMGRVPAEWRANMQKGSF